MLKKAHQNNLPMKGIVRLSSSDMCLTFYSTSVADHNIHHWVDNAKYGTARYDGLPWFSYHSADAVPIEGTVL